MSLEPESASWFRLDNEWRAQVAKRAAEYRRMQAEQRALRAAERAEATPVPLTLEALVDVIADRVAPEPSPGPTRRRKYAEHLVQSYCTCGVIAVAGYGDNPSEWALCVHAVDEGF